MLNSALQPQNLEGSGKGSGRIGVFCHYLCVFLNLCPLSLQQCQQGLQGSIAGLSVCKGTGRTENDSWLQVTSNYTTTSKAHLHNQQTLQFYTAQLQEEMYYKVQEYC